MAIQATVDLGNGVTASSCYIIVPNAYVKKFRPEQDGESATFKLIYDAKEQDDADIVFIKQDRKPVLVIMSLEDYINGDF